MSFDTKRFAEQLISEMLFYDEEYGAIGNLSLIDGGRAKERFIAFYSPLEQMFMIEEATAWEPVDPDEDLGVDYEFAADTKTFLKSDDPEELARTLMKLAEDQALYPSISLSFEDDDLV